MLINHTKRNFSRSIVSWFYSKNAYEIYWIFRTIAHIYVYLSKTMQAKREQVREACRLHGGVPARRREWRNTRVRAEPRSRSFKRLSFCFSKCIEARVASRSESPSQLPYITETRERSVLVARIFHSVSEVQSGSVRLSVECRDAIGSPWRRGNCRF